MGIQIISVSHKKAPLKIRELFSFTEEQQERIMKKMISYPGIPECVLLSTCNRTELYVYADYQNKSYVFHRMEDVLLGEIGSEFQGEVGEYLLFYNNDSAVDHLFKVAAGLDSMVIGEDQILGQVKDAHQKARKLGTTKSFLNTFFRDAVTAAKKVKTETDLSKTSVSTATLAVKAAEKTLGTLKDKKVMIIGATGKIGGIVLMNLTSLHQADIYVTTRKTRLILNKEDVDKIHLIDFSERYDYLDRMDVVISATASPHYVLVASKMKQAMKTEKRRVFIDLAVPMDIESKVTTFGKNRYFNIDDFTRIAKRNNEKKLHEAETAAAILEEYTLKFRQWYCYQKAIRPLMDVKKRFMEKAEKKGLSKAFDQLMYQVRDNNDPADLEKFFGCLTGLNEEEEKKMGKLYAVGFGPGGYDHMTAKAIRVIEEADIVTGYTTYVEMIRKYFPDKKFLATPMKKEIDRCAMAVDLAAEGNVVAMISSGDSGIYGMAGILLEVANEKEANVEIETVPGVTAASAAASVLGAPLMHDFTIISLSDLMTPLSLIMKRVECAGQGDFIVCLYNPKSKKRVDYVEKAADILMKYRDPDTPAGIVRNAGRDDESSLITTLKELKDAPIDMFSIVIIGNSNTYVRDGKIITPRGYQDKYGYSNVD